MTWQTIDSAPKDGTRVDLWCDGERICNARWDADQKGWVSPQPSDAWGVSVLEDDLVYFVDDVIYWMPIPQGPAVVEGN